MAMLPMLPPLGKSVLQVAVFAFVIHGKHLCDTFVPLLISTHLQGSQTYKGLQ
jgi:hypothetical protein